MNSMSLNAGFPVTKLFFGLTLFFAGTLFALGTLGLVEIDSLRRLAPVALILVGVAMEADALRRGRFGCGIVFVGVGTWLLAGSYHLFGLSFRTALPLAIIVIGVGLVVDSIMEGRNARKKENTHERRNQQ